MAHLSSNYYNGTVSEGQTITSDQTPLMSKIFAFDMSDSEEELQLFPNQGIHEKNVNSLGLSQGMVRGSQCTMIPQGFT